MTTKVSRDSLLGLSEDERLTKLASLRKEFGKLADASRDQVEGIKELHYKFGWYESEVVYCPEGTVWSAELFFQALLEKESAVVPLATQFLIDQYCRTEYKPSPNEEPVERVIKGQKQAIYAPAQTKEYEFLAPYKTDYELLTALSIMAVVFRYKTPESNATMNTNYFGTMLKTLGKPDAVDKPSLEKINAAFTHLRGQIENGSPDIYLCSSLVALSMYSITNTQSAGRMFRYAVFPAVCTRLFKTKIAVDGLRGVCPEAFDNPNIFSTNMKVILGLQDYAEFCDIAQKSFEKGQGILPVYAAKVIHNGMFKCLATENTKALTAFATIGFNVMTGKLKELSSYIDKSYHILSLTKKEKDMMIGLFTSFRDRRAEEAQVFSDKAEIERLAEAGSKVVLIPQSTGAATAPFTVPKFDAIGSFLYKKT
jgi:hypothetical protein